MFGEKKGRFRPAGGEISFWVSNRVTRVTNRSYAVVDPTADSAAGRAADSFLCHKKFCTKCEIFCGKDKKSTMLPQAKPAVIEYKRPV